MMTQALTTRPALQSLFNHLVKHLVLMAVAAIFFVPFYWLVITSFKPLSEMFETPARFIPRTFTIQNYIKSFSDSAFPVPLLTRNTLFYVTTTTLGQLLSSSLAAYAFARMRFWGRDVLFGITLATLMLPAIITLIPTYILFNNLGWVGSWAPLIAPNFLGGAFNIFLLRQFMLTIPVDLTDAARVDGAGEFTIFARVILPLVKPALMVIAVFHVVYAWNDFLGPLIYLSDSTQYPLVLGLYAFRTRLGLRYDQLLPAAVVVTLPLIILFFIAQRYFIEGISLTGIKG
jgi:multiple sugar transport system permease protein